MFASDFSKIVYLSLFVACPPAGENAGQWPQSNRGENQDLRRHKQFAFRVNCFIEAATAAGLLPWGITLPAGTEAGSGRTIHEPVSRKHT